MWRLAAGLIRTARPDDEEALGALVPDHHRRGWRLRYAADGQETMLVAAAGDGVCGVLSIRWWQGCDPPHPWLYGGAVLPALRRHGIGTALWLTAHQLCLQRGATSASLDVDVDNHQARRLYERLGYQVLGPHKHHWTARDINSEQIIAQGDADTWLMRCRLQPPRTGS